jgi:hypothetical protein
MKNDFLTVCPYCVEAIKSHGEKIVILDEDYTAPQVCEWCEEETEEIVKIRFR